MDPDRPTPPPSVPPETTGDAPNPASPRGSAGRGAGGLVDAALQREIDEALAGLSVEEMVGATGGPVRESVAAGMRAPRKGRVMRVHGGDVFVEFGPNSQGVCPLVQFDEPPAVGQEEAFVVERLDAFEGLLILSRPGAVQKVDWGTLAVGQVVEARCTGMNKGGLEMEVAHQRGFMPAGQIDIRPLPDISVLLGEKFPCKIIELRKEKGRLILSRRAVMLEQREQQRGELLAGLEAGQNRIATIVGVQAYGAFADLGGVDGLIPIGELAHERLKHASDAVKVGDRVEVKVVSVDRGQDPPRISLSRKQVLDNPASAFLQEIVAGHTVTGRVVRITDFGAFIELAPNVEGLVHISEVSHERIPSVASVLKPNEIVTAKVLSIDEGRGRISLSIKATKDAPARAAEDHGGKGERRAEPLRVDDPAMRKLRARFSGTNLKGGIG
jgi:ribosomal protein S1